MLIAFELFGYEAAPFFLVCNAVEMCIRDSVECDQEIPDEAIDWLRRQEGIIKVTYLSRTGMEECDV